jgi:hypothetical protein
MKMTTLGLALVALLGATHVRAASSVYVEALTMPAWVLKEGERRPLALGTPIADGQSVVTGDGARVQLKLADGSAVQLGANARFQVDAAAMKRDTGVFEATLRVLAGAFRFTTNALAKQTSRRDVQIQLPTVTAGIRGTDLWGKAQADRDFVVLIEGAIGVTRANGETVAMNEPLTLIDAPKNAPAPAGLATITPAELAAYAAETSQAPKSGVMRNGGKWKVIVARSPSQSEALATYDQLRDAGYAAAIRPVGSGPELRYRVQITGLDTREDAAALEAKLKTQLGVSETLVTR